MKILGIDFTKIKIDEGVYVGLSDMVVSEDLYHHHKPRPVKYIMADKWLEQSTGDEPV